MNTAIAAALSATLGFAAGDIFTAIFVRKVSGRAGMLVLTVLKLLLYMPFALVLRHEFAQVDAYTWWWSAFLGALFFVAYAGFNMAFEKGKNAALVGVVAGCFPASAAVVAIAFLHQRPSALTIVLLLAVLAGVVLIGLPERLRGSLAVDTGVLLALLPLVCWGIFGALLHEPVNHLGTPHAWFVVQTLVAAVMVIGVGLLYNRRVPGLVHATVRTPVWRFALLAGLVIGAAEAMQALSLGSGRQLVIIEALLGSYPAVYFLIAHKVFHEPLHRRQWLGIVVVAISIVLLSAGATS